MTIALARAILGCRRRSVFLRRGLYSALCWSILVVGSITHAHNQSTQLGKPSIANAQLFSTNVARADLANHYSSNQKLKALQITSKNAAELIQGGPDATGGIGDWFISNGTLCAIISDVEHEGEFSHKGGVLTDIGFCDRDDDYYTTAQDMLGARDNVLHAEHIELSLDQHNATIIVQLATDGVKQETRYSLNTTQPTVLTISKRVTRTSDDNEFNIYNPVQFNAKSLESFVLSSKDLDKSNGFDNEDFVSRGVGAIRQALRSADTIINHSPPSELAGVAYGWQLVSAQRTSNDGPENKPYDVPAFVVADDELNSMIIFPDTFYIGDGSRIGLLQIPQIPLLNLAVGHSLLIEERLYVGRHNDVASITDQLFIDAPIISGRDNDPTTALHIDFADGVPFTFVRPDEQGKFSFHAPAGDYVVHQTGQAGRATFTPLTVGEENIELATQSFPEAATVSLPQGQAMRLIFKGINDSRDPHFADTLTNFSVVEEDGKHFKKRVPHVFIAGSLGDPTTVQLEPGDYRVYATRGPEYSVEHTDITVRRGETHKLTITTPARVVETPNYIASDLHVHSGGSYDNVTSDKLRVRSFVAEHGEVMVSSEHDKPTDFAPLIKTMGIAQRITSIAAAEVTSLAQTKRNRFTNGHFNFFPYQPQPHAYRRGMVNHENKRIREVIHAVRQQHVNTLVQLNHPRSNLDLSGDLPEDYEDIINPAHYLDHMGSANYPYNPEKPLSAGKNASLVEIDPDTGLRDLDFDLIEIVNPSGEDHHERIKAVRKDWLSFLKQGEHITGTANSDSHNSAQQVAVPRTMVAMTNDSIIEFQQTDFLNSLKAGNAYGTTGPMLELSLDGVHMGGMLASDRGVLNLKITSADWIPVETLSIQVNGDTIIEQTLDKKAVTAGQQINIPLEFDQDSFVTIEISGPASDVYKVVYPGITPYAFSNPIYVDFDSDGQWQPPGL